MKRSRSLSFFLAALAAACEIGTNNVCLEKQHALETGGEQASARAARLKALAQGAHAAELTWQDGTRTEVRLELGVLDAKWVKSRRDPENNTDVGDDCRDRVRLLADATLRTGDGRLNERLEALALDETREGALSAWFARRTSALQGGYVRQSQGGTLTGLNLQIDLADAGFSGGVYENVKSEGGNGQSAALGRWGQQP